MSGDEVKDADAKLGLDLDPVKAKQFGETLRPMVAQLSARYAGIPGYLTTIISALTALAAFLGGLQMAAPSPSPTPPPNGGGGQQVAPAPDTKPSPAPPTPHGGGSGDGATPAPFRSPNPCPQPNGVPDTAPAPHVLPQPIGPVASITVQDSSGQPLMGEASPGQMIVISSSKSIHGPDPLSLVWEIDPPVQQYSTPDGLTIVMVMPTDPPTKPADLFTLKIQQVVSLNNKIAMTSVTIKSGRAPQPPPKPMPDPKPVPDPTPKPKPDPVPPVQVKNIAIAVVEDSLNRSPSTVGVLNAFAEWTKYGEAGNTWMIYRPDTKEAKGVEAVSALKAANKTFPGVVIWDKTSGVVLYADKLPATIADMTKLVNQFTGGAQ